MHVQRYGCSISTVTPSQVIGTVENTVTLTANPLASMYAIPVTFSPRRGQSLWMAIDTQRQFSVMFGLKELPCMPNTNCRLDSLPAVVNITSPTGTWMRTSNKGTPTSCQLLSASFSTASSCTVLIADVLAPRNSEAQLTPESGASGVFGLNLLPSQASLVQPEMNLFARVMKTPLTKGHGIFSLYLAPPPLHKDCPSLSYPAVSDSSLVIGGVDPSHVQTDISWVSLPQSQEHFAFSVSAKVIASPVALMATVQAVAARVYLPVDMFEQFADTLQREHHAEKKKDTGLYAIPCNTPSFDILTIKSEAKLAFSLTNVDLYAPQGLNNMVYLRRKVPYCVLNIAAGGSKQYLVLGIPFIRKYLTVFDTNNHRIGFALSSAPSTGTPEQCRGSSNKDNGSSNKDNGSKDKDINKGISTIPSLILLCVGAPLLLL
eukprot:Nk52_evm7s207 gene=Nk52_evmTU7s207